MECEAIRPVIRQFLDDLLDEKDYQEIQAHLVSCARCHAYASSVGTLSYRLYELGQVELPPGLESAILYEMKKTPSAAERELVLPQFPEEAGEPALARTKPFWFALTAAAFVSIGAIAGAFFWKPHASPGMTPPHPPKSEAVAGVSLSPARLAERHFHMALSGRPELADLIIELQLAVERDADRSIVFLVPADKSAAFQERLSVLSGGVKEFGESPANDADQRVTVFFE